MWLLNVGMFYDTYAPRFPQRIYVAVEGLPPSYLCNILRSYKTADCHPLVRRNVRLSFLGALLWALAVLSWAVCAFYPLNAPSFSVLS
jgi:hypothetical protein